ncbi:MAG TPA: 5'-nucleotidase C-terminal domain-containing protein [Polyangiaceae bacterium]|jgi:5'-nucleotidase
MNGPEHIAPIASAAASSPSPPLTLSVLGLNDLHGRLRALPAFAGYLDNVRRARAADGGGVAFVDAGDMFQGTLESNLTEGASVVTAYDALGVTLAALGNHEFDFGPAGPSSAGDPQGAIRARILQAHFPILSANLRERDGARPSWVESSRLVSIAGVRVGFVGLLTKETPSIVMSAWFQGLDVADLAPTLVTEASELRKQGAELVIAVAHAGADCKRFDDPHDLTSCGGNREIFDVAAALPPKLVDAIFAGHTHAGVAQIVNGIPIVEAYARGRAFSRIDFALDRRTHALLSSKLFPPHELCPKLLEDGSCVLSDYEGAPVRASASVEQAIAPALALADERKNQPLGVTLSDAIHGSGKQESALGNLFADLLREAVPGADVALLNGGTLRADFNAGPLKYGDVFEAMPFDNQVAQIRLTGAELKRLLLAHLTSDAHALISLSGIELVLSCDKTGPKLSLLRHGKHAIADQDSLLLATSDYLALGGDDLFRPLELPRERIQIDSNLLFRDALLAGLKKRQRLAGSDHALLDPAHPRLKLPSARPVRCP